jgi:hypothetical protein
LTYPNNPDAYELRLIDDDEDDYTPFMEISPLDKNEEIGEFESVAFIEAKLSKSSKIVINQGNSISNALKLFAIGTEDDRSKDKLLEETLR